MRRTRYGARGGAIFALAACLVALFLVGARPAGAQEAEPTPLPTPAPGPQAAERVLEVVAPLQALADAAARTSWQEADAAFNDILDALDAHQAPLVEGLGEPAAAAFAAIEARLGPLDEALAREDVAGVRGTVGEMIDALAPLAPQAGAEAESAEAADRVLAWQAGLERVRGRQRAEAWRDMRNEAIALNELVAEGRPALARTLGAEGADDLERARIFGLRLFAASLDMSAAEGDAAAARFAAAGDALLGRLGVLPLASPTPALEARARVRGFEVEAAPGETVALPIVIEDVPQIGLGALDLVLRWSPRALVLRDVTWEAEGGATLRDDAAGRAELRLPQAPIGPSGTRALAQLVFDFLPRETQPADYLPASELGALERALDEAVTQVRLGDVPKAATGLAAAYYALDDSLARPDGLGAALAETPTGALLPGRLLEAVDLASQPAPTDEIVVAIARASSALDLAIQERYEQLGPERGVPVTIEVLRARDTTGAPLPMRGVPGRVLPRGAGLLPLEPAEEGAGALPRPVSEEGPEGAAEDDEGVGAAEVAVPSAGSEAGGEPDGDGEGQGSDAPADVAAYQGAPGAEEEPQDDAASDEGPGEVPEIPLETEPDLEGAGLPVALLASLAIAAAIGLVATYVSLREEDAGD